MHFIEGNYQFTSRSRTEGNNSTVDTRHHLLTIPVSDGNLALQSTATRAGSLEWKTINDLTLTYPLNFLGTSFDAEYSVAQHRNTDKTDYRFSTKLRMPFQLQNEHIIAFSSLDTSRIESSFDIPFRDGPINLKRVAANHPDKPNSTVYTAVTPRISLLDDLSIQGGLLYHIQSDQSSRQKRNLDVAWQPSDSLKTTMVLSHNDLSPKEHRMLTVDTRYAISERTSMNFQYLQKQQLDMPRVNKRTQMEFQHQSSEPDGLRIRATAIDLDGPGQDYDMFRAVETSFGDKRILQLTMSLSDYDSSKMVPLPKTLFNVQAEHVLPKRGIRARYQSSLSVPVSQLELDTLWNLDSKTSLQLAMRNNPTDPRNPKVTREGTMWDLGFSTTIIDGPDIRLGLRRYQDNNWLNASVTGGTPEDYGQIRFSYQSGDFVPSNNTKTIPESTLNLNYDKRWDDSELTINLFKEISNQETIEGKMEFGIRF